MTLAAQRWHLQARPPTVELVCRETQTRFNNPSPPTHTLSILFLTDSKLTSFCHHGSMKPRMQVFYIMLLKFQQMRLIKDAAANAANTSIQERFQQSLPVVPPSDIDHINDMAQTSGLIQQPYPDVGQLSSPYQQQQSGKDLNQYATLKAVGEHPNSQKNARLCTLRCTLFFK